VNYIGCITSTKKNPMLPNKSLHDRPPWDGPKCPQSSVNTGPTATGNSDSPDKIKYHAFNTQTIKSCYKLMISSVTPRPIALISSTSKDGIDNVAPFSYFGAMAHDPPILSVGICRNGPNRAMKDSAKNVMDTGEAAINIISQWYLDAANHTCGNFDAGVDEFTESGLSKLPCEIVKAPRVAQAAVSYECKLWKCVPVENDGGSPTTEIMLLRVVNVHVREGFLVEGCDMDRPEVDTMKLNPIGRLGGNTYVGLGDTVDIPRPRV